MKRDRYIETLMNLGLTLVQATAYSALLRLGKANAKTISKASGIARTDVYRVMRTLEKLGLVEKIIAAPSMYKATSLKDAFKLLLKYKEEEYSVLKDRAAELVRNPPQQGHVSVFEEEQEFVLISSEKLSAEKIKIEDNRTRHSLDITGDWKGLKFYEYLQLEIHEKALQRGVKIRLITEKHGGDEFEKLYPSLFEYGGLFKIRYVDPPIPMRTAIYDKKRLNMSVNTPTDPKVTPTIWSSNPQFVKVIVAYFEQLWKEAEPSNVCLPQACNE
ncbi:MAG: TrmB family transcriptional regulator [Candidatus Bathyarchaeia archaeon]|jgi:sugar-specific transcriptional regulator TrmB